MEPDDLARRRELANARRDVERLEQEVATRSAETASPGELLFLLQRLEIARKRLQSLLDRRGSIALLALELLWR